MPLYLFRRKSLFLSFSLSRFFPLLPNFYVLQNKDTIRERSTPYHAQYMQMIRTRKKYDWQEKLNIYHVMSISHRCCHTSNAWRLLVNVFSVETIVLNLVRLVLFFSARRPLIRMIEQNKSFEGRSTNEKIKSFLHSSNFTITQPICGEDCLMPHLLLRCMHSLYFID